MTYRVYKDDLVAEVWELRSKVIKKSQVKYLNNTKNFVYIWLLTYKTRINHDIYGI